eukprot:TRINITY_DN481_c0_g3_i1.p1 TRINITY_DN481_c0_g3~~TRINITY_DN481_c0_g3_i1.p1  ORF type:complete len:492 (+),score=112.75 TRINITY_DN481_c0_g3_i1:141-1616(+)
MSELGSTDTVLLLKTQLQNAKDDNIQLRAENSVYLRQNKDLLAEVTELKAELKQKSSEAKETKNMLIKYEKELCAIQQLKVELRKEVIDMRSKEKSRLNEVEVSLKDHVSKALNNASKCVIEEAKEEIQMVREDAMDDFQNTVDEIISVTKDEIKEVRDCLSNHGKMLRGIKLEKSLGDWYTKLIECGSDVMKQAQLLFEVLKSDVSDVGFSYLVAEVVPQCLLWKNPERDSRNIIVESIIDDKTMTKFNILNTRARKEGINLDIPFDLISECRSLSPVDVIEKSKEIQKMDISADIRSMLNVIIRSICWGKFAANNSSKVEFSNQQCTIIATGEYAGSVIPVAMNEGVFEWRFRLDGSFNDWKAKTAFGIASELPIKWGMEKYGKQNLFFPSSLSVYTGVMLSRSTMGGQFDVGSVITFILDMNKGICSASINNNRSETIWRNLQGKAWYPVVRLFGRKRQKVSIVSFRKLEQKQGLISSKPLSSKSLFD